MAIIDSLLIELGFEYDPKDLGKFKKDLGSTTDFIKKFAKTVVAATAAVTGLVTVSTAATDKQGKFADKIGESVEMVDALQFALIRSGGSADGMNSSLESLSKRAGEAARGVGEGVEAFGLLGVNVRDVNGNIKSSSALMLEVSNAFQGISKAEQIDLSEKLGLGAALPLLQLGPKAIRELTREARLLGVTTKEDARLAAEFQDSLTDILMVVKDITRAISSALAPLLQEINQRFLEWWKLNRNVIKQKIPEWIEKAAVAMRLLAIAAGVFIGIKIINTFVSMLALFKKLTLSSLLFQGSFLTLPVLIGLALAAIAGLAEDAKVFFEGGDSLFGLWIEKFPKLESELISIAAVFATVWDMTKKVFDGWNEIFDLFAKNDIKDILKDIPGFLLDVTGLVKPEGTGALQNLGIGQSTTGTRNTNIDKIDILIQGGADSAENIANSVSNMFQQSTEELDSAVYQ